ncbi:MAG: hypothetical protein LBJ63_04890 [Prevotellaceae bacterium]|jgi:hypothetical protein|nr:hypothetical protein [Prevotellaceae bacterium]
MMKVNYRSDFLLLVRFRNLSGEIINIPDYNFILTFKTAGSWNTYAVDVDRDRESSVYKVVNDTDLLVIFNSHNLGKGLLECEWKLNIPNDIMPDSEMNLVVVNIQDIELWDGESDMASAEISMELIMPYVSSSDITSMAIAEHNADIGAHANIVELLNETINEAFDSIVEITVAEINAITNN